MSDALANVRCGDASALSDVSGLRVELGVLLSGCLILVLAPGFLSGVV